MFSYWAQEMQKIESFKVLSRLAKDDSQTIGIIGFTKTVEGVFLHVLKASMVCQEEYMDFGSPHTHRVQMTMGINQKEETPLWARKVYFGSREILAKGSQSCDVDTGQIHTSWLLAEALRQGWQWEAFEEMYSSRLYITTLEMDMDWSELDTIISESPIRFERDDHHKSYLVEAPLMLPIESKFIEPIEISLREANPELDEIIFIHGIELRDMWQDFEEIYEYHRQNGTFTEEALEQFQQENEKHFELICPRGMYFPVVTYESKPKVSIECHTLDYLESLVDYSQTNSASSIFDMYSTNLGGTFYG